MNVLTIDARTRAVSTADDGTTLPPYVPRTKTGLDTGKPATAATE